MELHRHCVDCLITLTSLGSACLQVSIRNMRGKAKCLVPCSLQPSQKDKRKKEFLLLNFYQLKNKIFLIFLYSIPSGMICPSDTPEGQVNQFLND